MGDRGLALEKYRRLARRYDFLTGWERVYRRRAVEKMSLKHGDVVLDVACGTGINFRHLEECIGPDGTVIGIDLSPEMLQHAERRVRANGWRNVLLIQAPAQEAEIPSGVNAVLFCLTHDVLRSDEALDNIFTSTIRGARVAAYGPKWAPRWAVPVNWAVRMAASRFVTTFDGFDQPWDKLERFVPNLRVEPIVLGGAYIASGRT
jgi:SAM-dependent methyltransferase